MSEDERQRDSYKKNYLSAAGVIYWSKFTDTSTDWEDEEDEEERNKEVMEAGVKEGWL